METTITTSSEDLVLVADTNMECYHFVADFEKVYDYDKGYKLNDMQRHNRLKT